MEQITVKEGDSGQRLDKYLGKYLKKRPKVSLTNDEEKEHHPEWKKGSGK